MLSVSKTRTMKSVDFLIIGSGPCGLGAASRIDQIAPDKTWLMVDKESTPGGLSRTLCTPEGFKIDFGGHVLFSKCRYFDDIVQKAVGPYDSDAWLNHKRISHVVMKDTDEVVRKIAYPFQKNLKDLSKGSMMKCLKGLLNRDQRVPPKNFGEWIVYNFGQGIADIFMNPYNFKVWAHDPHQMGHLWVQDRVASIDSFESVKSILEDKEDSAWGPNARFVYPRGGTGEIYIKIAGMLPSENQMYNTSVETIDKYQKIATLSDGSKVKYDKLISTLPLDILMRMLGTEPDMKFLKHSSTNVILFGFEGSSPNRDSSWMYFPDENVPFYRCTNFSNYSPLMVPDPEIHYSLMLEVSESEFKPVDQDTLIGECLDACKQMGLVSEGSKVVSEFKTRCEYGYPVAMPGDREYRRELRKDLKELGIYSRGRFGNWDYSVSNQDGSLLQGVQAVDNALFGCSESWVETPDFEVGRYNVDYTYF